MSGKWTEQSKAAWSKKCRETGCNNGDRWTTENRRKAGERLKKHNIWTPERREQHSRKMKEAVQNNPDSYTKKNVSGRAKLYTVLSSSGETTVKGSWELKIANWLNENQIAWTNDIEPYSYFWNCRWHLYFPDFLLLESNLLIEVKGYQRERDEAKWKSVTDRELIILKQKQLQDLSFLHGRVSGTLPTIS